jgi:hypothetical protein
VMDVSTMFRIILYDFVDDGKSFTAVPCNKKAMLSLSILFTLRYYK